MKLLVLGSSRKIHILRWTQWLAEHGLDVALISDTEPSPEFPTESVRLHRPQWGFIDKLRFFKLQHDQYANNREKWRAYRPIIAKEKPDVLLAHEALAYGPALVRFPQYPRVLNPWGPDIERLADPKENPEAKRLIMSAAKAADVITTNAPGLEDHWAALTQQPLDKFHLFSWGVNLQVFHRRNEEEQHAIRKTLGLPAEAPLVLSPRLAQPYYNIELLMRAWAKAGSGETQLVLLRAGANEPPWRELQQLHGQLPSSSILMIDRHLNENEMAALYSTCEAMVMLPQTDLVASSLIEGMACGCLPVLVDLPCYRTVVEEMAAPGNLGQGIYLATLEEHPAIEALNRFFAMTSEQKSQARETNIAYCKREQDWDKCGLKMIKAIELARERFANRH